MRRPAAAPPAPLSAPPQRPFYAPQELPTCFVVNAYVPNSGDGLTRLSYRLNEWVSGSAQALGGLSGTTRREGR